MPETHEMGSDRSITDGTDCDDTTAAVHPGAEEVCDTLDNDCDDAIDEGVTTGWYTDTDGDGYGSASDFEAGCEQPEGTSDVAGDCDDENDQVNPSAIEVCNSIDDDCDGLTDCDDVGCRHAPGCPFRCYASENNPTNGECSNGIDDDCDDRIDCEDTGCRNTAACDHCHASENNPDNGECTNGIDDDCDGRIDCEDGGCADTAACD